MSTTPPLPQNAQPSCLVRGLRFLIRAIFVLLIGTLLGIGTYYGAILLYDQYVSLTQDHETRLAALEMNRTETENLITEGFSSLQTRLETLELQGDTHKEEIASLESSLANYEEYLSLQATAVMGYQATQDDMQETILALQTQIGILQTDLESIQSGITAFESDLGAVESAVDDLTETLEGNQALVDTMQALSDENEARMLALQNEMTWLQVMQLLTRARLSLVQGNATLAISDIEAAQTLMAGLQANVPDFQVVYVEQIMTLLDDTLGYLPNTPLTAADQLESAWQMLVNGLPTEAEAAEMEADTAETNAEAEETPAPSEEATPTPTATPQP